VNRTNDIGVVGLGVMGANLARNLAGHGFRVSGFARHLDAAHALAAAYPAAKLEIAASLAELVRGLERPRRVLLMVNAGQPVDDVLDGLDPLLEQGDVVVDGGNSLYLDTERRLARAKTRPWSFVGMGVSGGAEGALNGPAIMPGGDPASYERLRPLLEKIAARSTTGACVTWCGHGSAGHFVKMVHNGIEYGDMQLIAEVVLLMRQGLQLSGGQAAAAFAAWNTSELESYLIEITRDILRTPDPDKGAGSLLLDAILDQAGQKGTGAWTVNAAIELGVAIPTIAAAVDARSLSAARPLRLAVSERLGGAAGTLAGVSVEDLGEALYAAKIASYAQGFALLARASAERGYATDLAEVARIWTAGCIIRARFLERVRAAFRDEPTQESLVLAPDFSADLARREPAWRRVVAAATLAGLPVPGLAASLSWFDTLRTARGSAAMIQAQRDYFGSHTYERVERPGVAVHSDWAGLRGRV